MKSKLISAFAFLILTLLIPFGARAASGEDPTFKANVPYLRKELKKMGLSKAFIDESLKNYEPKSFGTVVTLNLLGFLRPAGEHMNQVTPLAVENATNFIEENRPAFDLAEKRYRVPPDVISSLLWIETRHGENLGKFHIVSVYLHLLQANRGKVKNHLTKLALKKNLEEKKYTKKEIRKMMAERSRKKSEWAKEQLYALAAIRKEKNLNLKTLRGSYAGAFGLPQFIPSSYKTYARAAKESATPILTRPADAIMSVGYYLSKSGWRNRREETHVEALMKYNNSRDYADSILEISQRVTNANAENQKKRSVSSEPSAEAE